MKKSTAVTMDLRKLSEASGILKAISHPLRLGIVNLLHDGSRMNVTEIFTEMQIEQAVASHHLSILKDRGVVAAQRNGKNIFYSLKHPQLSQVIECINTCI